MKVDLTWIDDGMFTTFLVNSQDGMIAFNEIFKVSGANKVLNIHRQQTIDQLKEAGYGIRKSNAKPGPINARDLALIDALNA